MLRIALSGASLGDFPEGCEGGYIKLVLPRAGAVDVAPLDPATADLGDWVRRSYTIRALDREHLRLTLDFVVQGHGGYASDWVGAAKEGDHVLVAGPGPVKAPALDADGFFLASDMAGLPSLSVQLERLPRDARGQAVVEVLEAGDEQALDGPSGVDITWIVNPDVMHSRLPEAVRARPWPSGRVSMWAACEFQSMKQLRSYFFEERKLDRADCYLSSYWKLNATDEQHKLAKRQEAQG